MEMIDALTFCASGEYKYLPQYSASIKSTPPISLRLSLPKSSIKIGSMMVSIHALTLAKAGHIIHLIWPTAYEMDTIKYIIRLYDLGKDVLQRIHIKQMDDHSSFKQYIVDTLDTRTPNGDELVCISLQFLNFSLNVITYKQIATYHNSR